MKNILQIQSIRFQRVLCILLIIMGSVPATDTFANDVVLWTFDNATNSGVVSDLDEIAGLIGSEYGGTGVISIDTGFENNGLRLENGGLPDTQGDVLLVPDDAQLTGHVAGAQGFDSITIEADIRFDTLTNQAQIVRKVDTDSGFGYELFVRDSGHVGFRVQGQSGLVLTFSKNAIAPDGQWHHIEGTVVENRNLYNSQVVVDGVVTRRTQHAGQLTNTISPLTLGGFVRNSNEVGQRFDGWIDNVHISTNRTDLLDTSGVIDPTPVWDSSGHLMNQTGFIESGFIANPMPTPEVHAASITQRSDGAMVAVWFGGTVEGHPDVGIWQSEYENNAWAAPHEVVERMFVEGSQGSIFNPVVYQRPDNGPMMLFYLSGLLGESLSGNLKTSNDGGHHWSESQSLPAGVLGPDRNQPILLDSGVLLAPTSGSGTLKFNRTTNYGQSWIESSSAPDPNGFSGLQPAILEHQDGRLQALGRSVSGSIVTSWSDDEGLTWSALKETNLPNNNSGIGAMTLSDGRQLIAYNHTDIPDGAWGGPRTPLNLAISEDGVNWDPLMILEDQPGEYSYPAVYQSEDGLVHVVYTWNRLRIKHAIIDLNGPGLDGDYNNDGTVDAADYTVWRDNLGDSDETSLHMHGNGTNGVDAADYTLWQANYGRTASIASLSEAVPEPGSIVLISLGLLCSGIAGRSWNCH